MNPWDLIGSFVTRLGTDIQQLLPSIREAIDTGNLEKRESARECFTLGRTAVDFDERMLRLWLSFADTGQYPWILRSELIKNDAATNADAEVKVIKQSEEINELVKQIKLRVSFPYPFVDILLLRSLMETFSSSLSCLVLFTGPHLGSNPRRISSEN